MAPYLGSRSWGILNVVIEFDHAGVVQSWKIIKDKELLAELESLEQNSPTLNLSTPLIVDVKSYLNSEPMAELALASDSFEYKASRGFKIAREDVIRINSISEPTQSDPNNPMAWARPDPSRVWVAIRFAKRTARGRSINVGIDPPNLIVLQRYLHK